MKAYLLVALWLRKIEMHVILKRLCAGIVPPWVSPWCNRVVECKYATGSGSTGRPSTGSGSTGGPTAWPGTAILAFVAPNSCSNCELSPMPSCLALGKTGREQNDWPRLYIASSSPFTRRVLAEIVYVIYNEVRAVFDLQFTLTC